MTEARKPRRSRLRAINIPAWMYIFLILLYDELLFHIWITDSFSLGRFLCMLLFALSFCAFSALLCSLGRSATFSRVLAIVLSSLLGVLYITEYLVNDAFKNFMTLGSLFTGAGDVAGDFAGTVFSLIFQEFWRILLFIVPIVLYAVLGHKGGWGRAVGGRIRCVFGFGCVFLFCLAYLSMLTISPDTKKYGAEYDFDSAVHDFGLVTALRLDLSHGSGGDQPASFVQVPVESSTEPSDSSAEMVTEPTEYGENVMDIDFAALAEQTSDSDLASIDTYVASQTPSKKNEYTGLFAGKNLIFITAEAFSLEAIDKDLTPTLYRLATKGIHFTDYTQPAWGGSTSTGEYSNLVGLVPVYGVDSIQKTVGKNMYFTLGNQLQRLGYFSEAYHNNTYTYYNRDKTHTNLGYSQFIGMGNGMEEGVEKVWPESDKQMIEFTLDRYIDKQPFSVYYMSVSGHGLYSLQGNTMSYRNYDAVKDMPYSETVQCYYASQLELEYAMEALVSALEKAGIADDTVIVLGSDHYPYCLDKSTAWGTEEDYLAELYGYTAETCFQRDHSALIIWSGCIEDKHLEVDTPVYSLDIVPTLSNLFGLEYDSRLLVGRDVFSEQMPLVIWNGYSWKTDKGTYDSASGTFTPNEGVTVSDDYVSTVSAIVGNKINYSKAVLDEDYFGALFGPDETQ